MPADDASKPTSRTHFGSAKKYPRQGSSHHKRGWQETPPSPPAGSKAHLAPVAPKDRITRTPIAERLRQLVDAQEKKGEKT